MNKTEPPLNLSKKYRPTRQREAIYDVIADNRHLSAEEIYRNSSAECPEVSLPTVYRTLELFCRENIVRKLDFGDGCFRYELSGEQTQHLHMICSSCGKIIEANTDMETILQNTNTGDFTVTESRMFLYGLCAECFNRNSDNR